MAALTYQHSAFSSLFINRQECLSVHLKRAIWLDIIIVANLVIGPIEETTSRVCVLSNWRKLARLITEYRDIFSNISEGKAFLLQGVTIDLANLVPRILSLPAYRAWTLETRLWPRP